MNRPGCKGTTAICLYLLLAMLAVSCALPSIPAPIIGVAEEIPFSYQVEPCDENISTDELEHWAKVDLSVKDGAILLEQDLVYTCCARIELRLEAGDNRLRIVESNRGDVCRCMCGYRVHGQISDLAPGEYVVQVCGVEYPGGEPATLLGEAKLAILDP